MDRFACISVFVAAVEEGSLVAAGRRFGLSASMAGKYLAWLESDLNARLIQRSTRSLSITDAGRAYYSRCKRILEQFDEANQEASDASATLRGPLRIAAPVSFGALHMGDIIARFLADHPQVSADVLLDDHYVDLHTAGIDVAIRIGRLPDSDLVARRLAPCRMVFCAAPSYLARHGTPQTPADLHAAPRLAFSGAVTAADWRVTDAAGGSHQIAGPLRAQANNMQLLLAMAVAGLGVAYGPTFAFGPAIAQGKLRQLLPDCAAEELTVQAIYPSSRYLPSKVRSFIDHVAAAFADAPQWDQFCAGDSV
ncbi:DNA-binding transcriptional LysR family regulator [Duganella sp. 1224]|uniref:LysR family transcriptional regulator n=1 Tax=Duganella sp. 1224 TaxID=2587052 RepID=UPI0015C7FD47|nr:LysR family transcriptional regulator [Duganella sp. 1224]NYE63636.1 DNA-binding transcriptional LysR family regulator [Duganella sp. 1224]